ncbi:MAG: histidine kinase, partial [Kiritimatiellaeota bacterium]|nr:histidine kinase [Kiritimatiellota bacterium]
ETEFLRDDGTGGHLLVQGTSVRGEDGRLIRLYGTVQDVTDRKRLEQQILKISEREQRRIGQDLHDGVGQQLTALRFLSSALRQKLLDHKTVAAGEFARLDTLLSETIKEVRGLARGLHPVNADSHGLMHGLQELCRTMQFVFGVSCVFECANPVLVHDPTVALNLYRITQEAVRNAATHGKPKTICVQLSRQEQTLKLVVSDDGQGLPREKKQQGMGLEIMQYRASAIGASLAVQSEPGAGVTITVTLPIPS